jgi:small neutral amino acid transporter SnatA (MarC family)
MAWQSLLEFVLLATSSLFVIVDPIATVPAFLAMTPNDSPERRVKTARLACWVTASVLLLFAFAGKLIFRFLGITMPAFQLAALARGMQWLSPIALRITTRVMGLLLAAIAFQFMLNAIAALRGTRF